MLALSKKCSEDRTFEKGEGKMRKAFGNLGFKLKRSSPTILTSLAGVGVIVTAVMAAKATPKALNLVKEARIESISELSTFEIICAGAPAYIPTAITCLATISCMLGANILNKRQQASLMSAYALLSNAYKEYRGKTIEMLGNDGEENIRKSIAKDHFNQNEQISLNDNELLFYDEWSNRYFNKTMEEVRNAEYHFNRNFVLRGYAELNELYEFLGLEPTKLGATIGWSIRAGLEFYGYQWVDFWHDLFTLEDGLECYFINMPFPPTADFMDY